MDDCFARRGNLALRPQWRICDWKDVLCKTIADQLGIRPDGMNLDLVDGGRNIRICEKMFQVGDGEIGYSNCFCLASLVQSFEFTPDRFQVGSAIFVDDVLLRVVRVGHDGEFPCRLVEHTFPSSPSLTSWSSVLSAANGQCIKKAST